MSPDEAVMHACFGFLLITIFVATALAVCSVKTHKKQQRRSFRRTQTRRWMHSNSKAKGVTMHITIKGVDNSPRWDTIQLLMRELTGDPLLQITRIAQFDAQTESQWELDFRNHKDQLVRANLTLEKW